MDENATYVFEENLVLLCSHISSSFRKHCLSQHTPSNSYFTNAAADKVIQKVTHTILNIGLFLVVYLVIQHQRRGFFFFTFQAPLLPARYTI